MKAIRIHEHGGPEKLQREEIPARIWPLPARRINGIGPKAAERLATLGIETIGQLAAAKPELLQVHFGLGYAAWLLRAAHGEDERPLSLSRAPKSVSRETTFERDLHPRQDRAALGEIFTALCTRVAADLERKGYRGRTVGIKLRYDDFQTVTRDLTLPEAVAAAADIRRAAGECLRRVPLDRRLRLLGVRIGGLEAATAPTAPRQGELLL